MLHLALYPLLVLSALAAIGAILVAVAKDGPVLGCIAAYLTGLASVAWSAWMLGLIDLQVTPL